MTETATKTKHLYDLHILLSPSAVDADSSAVEQKLNDIIQEQGGVIERADKAAKRSLAYPIKKDTSAYVSDIYFRAEPSAIEEIQAELKISELEILRFMILKDDQEQKARKPKKKRREKPEKTETKETAKKSTEPAKKEKKEEVSEVKNEDDVEAEEKETTKTEAEPSSNNESEYDDKTTLEDIDKRLDDIMENL